MERLLSPKGPPSQDSLIKVAKYEAAQEQAFSISQRSAQGAQLAMEDGRNVTSAHTPYACWRMYLTADGKPSHIIRDLRDGRQEKLDPQTRAVIDVYGEIGGGSRGHYRKQKNERVLLMPGDADKVEIVREIFDLHFRKGWGGKRIADVLNRRAVRSSYGKAWSQHQVEVIYENEVYTGRSVGNRTSSAIYHERQANTPKRVDLDPSVLATAKNLPVRMRPLDEWFIQEQPLMADFLDAEICKIAMADHERLWRHRADPDRPRQSKSRHQESDYLLTGLMFAKQDGEPLVGVLCGRVGKKVRYYRHKRGRRGYIKGSIYNRIIIAEPLERAVLEVIQQILSDLPGLTDQIESLVREQSQIPGPTEAELDQLRQQRDQIRKRTELIVANLDEETLADARPQIEQLKAQRRELDERIAAAQAAQSAQKIDPKAVSQNIMDRLTNLSANIRTMPLYALRQFLRSILQRAVCDMETKSVELHLTLPADLVDHLPSFKGLERPSPMRLVGTSASSTSYETHPTMKLSLGLIECSYVKVHSAVCYECRRRIAA